MRTYVAVTSGAPLMRLLHFWCTYAANSWRCRGNIGRMLYPQLGGGSISIAKLGIGRLRHGTEGH